jgi:hypothetical protein
MPARKLASFAIAVLSAAFGACSDQSPVAPGPASGAALQVDPLAQPVEGAGDISFITGSLTSEGRVVILVAQVTAEGNPAQGGVVIFQFCVQGVEFGVPTGALPSAECEPGGSGVWKRLPAVPVVAGEASFEFCCVTSTLGFRFVYQGRGSGISNFTIQGEDYNPPA